MATTDQWDQFGEGYDHPAFAGTPRTYVIASTPRSGSHMLGHLLFGTGHLGSPLEYLHPRHLATWAKRLGTASASETLRSVMVRRTSPSGWFGVKAHWPQFASATRADPDLARMFDDATWIQIRRVDRVAEAISLVIARQTNAWISHHDVVREPVYDSDLISAAIAEIKAQEAAWSAYLAGLDATPIAVEYEELVADPGAIVAMICERMGVPTPVDAPVARTGRQADERNAAWRERYLSTASDDAKGLR